MKKEYFYQIFIFMFGITIFGCVAQGAQETEGSPASETKTVVSADSVVVESAQTPAIVKDYVVQNVAKPQETAKESNVSASPSARDIQQSLKNAGVYEGAIDGKIGPMTTQAIKDFQAKNDLKVDGKVGPSTWSKLKGYSTTEPVDVPINAGD